MPQIPQNIFGPCDNLEDANKALKVLEKFVNDLEARLNRMYQIIMENE